MDLYEYQGKQLFEQFGIPVSEGRLAATPAEARAAAEELGGPGRRQGAGAHRRPWQGRRREARRKSGRCRGDLAQVLEQTDKRTHEIAHQVFEQAQRALTDAANEGLRPISNNPEDIHEYVWQAFKIDEGLHSQLKAAKDTASVYEVSIVDRDSVVLISTDESIQGKFLPRRTPLSQLTQRGFVHQVKVLAGPPKVYELDFPFSKGGQPFGEVRVAVSSGLLLNDILPTLKQIGTIVLLALIISTGLAAIVSGATLAPLRGISDQLDRISAGQFDMPAPEVKGFVGGTDELGAVSRKITQVGQQLRGVHEIFSTMRENMNSVMAGMEDGLIIFSVRRAR